MTTSPAHPEPLEPDPREALGSPDTGWLCPTEGHRARMMDMGPRVGRARNIAMAAMAMGILVAGPVTGWLMIPVFVVAFAAVATADRRIERARRPERVIARMVVGMILLTGVSAVVTGGATSPVLPLLVIPVGIAAARFRATVVWTASGFAALVAVAVTVTDPTHPASGYPLLLMSTLVLLVAVVAAILALMDAELQYRSQSVLDPLTGLLNRAGLESRFSEVAEQARLLDQPVCMIVCDLDNFKRVNDTWGHSRGDTVLRDVSYEMRKSLRSFELFYRLGGEEFLVLLPGIDLPAGIGMAQTLRERVEQCRPGDLEITASFGVSVGTGADLSFQKLYRAADEALYRSKHAGRNTVAAAGVTFPAEDPVSAED